MATEKVKLSELKLWLDNPRGIEKGEFETLKRRLTEKRQFKNLLINQDNIVLGGNMRLRAMRDLGWADAKVTRVNTKDKAEMIWYALVDNEKSGYYEDEKLAELAIDLPDLDDIKIDLGKSIELGDLKDKFRPIEEDDVPEVREGEPDSKLGEIYELGRHRLMCGDATKKEDVEKLMDGKKAELLFTSPPYSDMREYGGDKNLNIEHLVSFIPVFYPFANYQIVNLGIQRKDNEINQYWDAYIKSAKDCGYKVLAWNVWSKRNMGGSIANMSAMFPIEHEWVFVFGKEYKEINRTKKNKSAGLHTGISNRQKDGTTRRVSPKIVKEYGKLGSVLEMVYSTYDGHPAVFPVGFPAEYIKSITNTDDVVVDCFGGSGSTLIACEQTDRICYMMEIDPKYCDVIRKRYANYTEETTE